jgi:hypothetical protein
MPDVNPVTGQSAKTVQSFTGLLPTAEMTDGKWLGNIEIRKKRGMRDGKGASIRPFLFAVFLFGFLLRFFLFQTNLVFSDERTELGIVVLLAVQRIV